LNTGSEPGVFTSTVAVLARDPYNGSTPLAVSAEVSVW